MRQIQLSIVSFLLVFGTGTLVAQKAVRSHVRSGNKQYEQQAYTQSEIEYRKALELNPRSPEALYNLGNALFKQEKAKDALEMYQVALSQVQDPGQAAQILHNIGNAGMQEKDYSKAVEAYRMALRYQPSDDETRYNLAVAQSMLKQQQQQQQQKEDESEQEKEQEKEQQDQQQQDHQDQQQQQQEQDQSQEQEGQEQVSKEKAQQLLDALMQDEQELQEKVRKLQMQQGQSRNPEKDW
ncbi:MAG: tetratricopeptide repeat protein [Bacteroidales bacterium]